MPSVAGEWCCQRLTASIEESCVGQAVATAPDPGAGVEIPAFGSEFSEKTREGRD